MKRLQTGLAYFITKAVHYYSQLLTWKTWILNCSGIFVIWLCKFETWYETYANKLQTQLGQVSNYLWLDFDLSLLTLYLKLTLTDLKLKFWLILTWDLTWTSLLILDLTWDLPWHNCYSTRTCLKGFETWACLDWLWPQTWLGPVSICLRLDLDLSPLVLELTWELPWLHFYSTRTCLNLNLVLT